MMVPAFLIGGWIDGQTVEVAQLIPSQQTWQAAEAAADGTLHCEELIVHPAGGFVAIGPNSFTTPPGTPPPGSVVNRIGEGLGPTDRMGRFYPTSGSIAVSANGTAWITSGSAARSYDATGQESDLGTAWTLVGDDWVPLSMPSFITNPYGSYVAVGWRHVVAGDGDQVFFAGDIGWQDSVSGTNKNYKAAMYENGVWTPLGAMFESVTSPGVTCVGMIRRQNGNLLAAFWYAGATTEVSIEEWDGVAWTVLGTISDFEVAYITPMVEDANGSPWIAGMDSNSGVPLVYMFNGTAWLQRGNLSGYADAYLNTIAAYQDGQVYLGGWSSDANACLFEWPLEGSDWVPIEVPGSPNVEVYALIPTLASVPDPQPTRFVNPPVTVNIYDFNPDEKYLIKRTPDGVAPPGQEVEYIWNPVPGASSFPAPQIDPDTTGPNLVLKRLKPGRFLFRFTAQWGITEVYEQDFWINVRPKPGQAS